MIDDFLNAVAMAFVGLILLATGFIIGAGTGARVREKEAIERGFGEYVADQETGKANFKWHDPRNGQWLRIPEPEAER